MRFPYDFNPKNSPIHNLPFTIKSPSFDLIIQSIQSYQVVVNWFEYTRFDDEPWASSEHFHTRIDWWELFRKFENPTRVPIVANHLPIWPIDSRSNFTENRKDQLHIQVLWFQKFGCCSLAKSQWHSETVALKSMLSSILNKWPSSRVQNKRRQTIKWP